MNKKINRIACIGSRDIDEEQKELAFKIGKSLAEKGIQVASGNAFGSDEWFGKGVNSVDPELLILYIPWMSYNRVLIQEGNKVTWTLKPEWEKIAEKNHPVWDKLTQGAKKLMTRNVGIISKSSKVVGFVNGSKPGGGGSGHSFRVAEVLKIPTLDIGDTSICELDLILEWVYS